MVTNFIYFTHTPFVSVANVCYQIYRNFISTQCQHAEWQSLLFFTIYLFIYFLTLFFNSFSLVTDYKLKGNFGSLRTDAHTHTHSCNNTLHSVYIYIGMATGFRLLQNSLVLMRSNVNARARARSV